MQRLESLQNYWRILFLLVFIEEVLTNPAADGACPTPGCDGLGHVSGQWKTHYTYVSFLKKRAWERLCATYAVRLVNVFSVLSPQLVRVSTSQAFVSEITDL